MASPIAMFPEELTLQVFNNLERLDDLYAVMLTCKQFHRISLDVKAEKISQLALHSGNYFPALRPIHHFLLVTSARRLSDWAREDEGRQTQLKTTMHGGVTELAVLAMKVASISLADIRATSAWKRDTVVPISKRLDVSCGPTSREGISDRLTVCEDLDLALFTWAIYGELFDHVLYRDQLSQVAILDSITRFKFLVFCIPDVNSFLHMRLEEPHWFGDMGAVRGERFQQISLDHAMDGGLSPSNFTADISTLSNLIPSKFDYGYFVHANTCRKSHLFFQIVMNSGRRSLEVLQTAHLARSGQEHDSANTTAWLREVWAFVNKTMGTDDEISPPTADHWLNNHVASMGHDLQFTLRDYLPYTLRMDASTTEDDAYGALHDAVTS